MKKQNPNAIVPNNVIENWKKFTIILSEFYENKDFISNKNFYFFPGSFFLMSKNIINKIIIGILKNNLIDKGNIKTTPDDVAITAMVFLYFGNVDIINTNMFTKRCEKIETEYEEVTFHIRNRTDMYFGNRDTDIENIIHQVKKYYNENFEIM